MKLKIKLQLKKKKEKKKLKNSNMVHYALGPVQSEGFFLLKMLKNRQIYLYHKPKSSTIKCKIKCPIMGIIRF